MVNISGNSYYSSKPLDEIKNLLKKYRAPKIKGLPPFCGGLVGYFAYDSYKYFEPKLELKSKDVAGFKDFELYMYDKVICFDAFKQKIIIIVNIKTGTHVEQNYLEALNTIEEKKKLLKKSPNLKEEKIKIIEKPKSIDDEKEYEEKLSKIKKHI
jgi:anthranilate synthase component 1